MNYVMIRHKVKHFKKWKTAYDAHGPARDGVGLKERCLLRNTKSRNDVWILFEANNLARARLLASNRIHTSLRLLVLRSRQRSFNPTPSRAGPCASYAVFHFLKCFTLCRIIT